MKCRADVSHSTREALIGAIKAKRDEMEQLDLTGIEHQRPMVRGTIIELGGILAHLESDCAPESYGCDLLITFK